MTKNMNPTRSIASDGSVTTAPVVGRHGYGLHGPLAVGTGEGEALGTSLGGTSCGGVCPGGADSGGAGVSPPGGDSSSEGGLDVFVTVGVSVAAGGVSPVWGGEVRVGVTEGTPGTSGVRDKVIGGVTLGPALVGVGDTGVTDPEGGVGEAVGVGVCATGGVGPPGVAEVVGVIDT